jgi:hypothetical protein
MLAIKVPADALATKMASFTDGIAYFVPLADHPEGGAWIGWRHESFNDIEARYNKWKQSTERNKRASVRQLRRS